MPITINYTEEMENRKSDSAMKLLAAKTEQAMLTLRDQINSSIYSAQTGKAPLGFQDIIADAPGTTPTTLGGVTVASNTWWKNKTNNATADTSFQTIVNTNYEGMVRMSTRRLERHERRQRQPSNIFTTNDLYVVRGDLSKALAYHDLSSKDSPGVDGRLPSFRGIPVQYDRDCGTGRIYFLNTKYLKMHMQAGMNFAKTPFKEPANQMAKVGFIVVGLQITTNNRRRQGVIYNIND